MVVIPSTGRPATAVAGTVIVDGPGGVVYSPTPQAATQTSARLADAAGQASAQLCGMNEEVKPDVGRVDDIPPDNISL